MTDKAHAPGGCRALVEELFDYVDGDLSTPRCRALERHLAKCPCCDALAGNLRMTIAACKQEGRRRLPAPVRKKAKERIARLLAEL